jgi:hypothetical protein
MKTLLLILSITAFLFGKKPVSEARFFLEDTGIKKQLAFNETGEKGRMAFTYLTKSSYRLSVEFPQQEGKWIKEKKRHSTLTKASFNEKNNSYYYQGTEGYFVIKFKSQKRIDKENFRPVFKEIKEEDGNKITIAEFRTRKNGAGLELRVKAITAKQFKRATMKIKNDISTLSIQGIK